MDLEKAFLDVIASFGFEKERDWVLVLSFVFIVANSIGGMISGLFIVYSSSLRRPKLKTRISFRLFIVGEAMLFIFAIYYQVFVAETLSLAHFIYWVAMMMIMPLLAIIGAQTMYIAFMAKINAKERAAQKIARKKRHDRTETMEVDHTKVVKGDGKKPA